MPVCSIDDFKKKKTEGEVVTSEELEELRQLLNKYKAKEEDEKSELYNEFENVVKLIEESNKDISDEALEKVLSGVSGFSDLLEKSEGLGHSYTYKLLKTLDKDDGKRLIEIITKIDSIYETNVDTEWMLQVENNILKDNINFDDLDEEVIDDNYFYFRREGAGNDDFEDDEDVPSFDEYLELKENETALDDNEAKKIGDFLKFDIEKAFSKNELKNQYPEKLFKYGEIIRTNGEQNAIDSKRIREIEEYQNRKDIEAGKITENDLNLKVMIEIKDLEERNEKIKSDFENLKNFKAYLEEKDESKKTNFQKIYDVLSDDKKIKFIKYLNRLNSVLHLGLKSLINSVNPNAEAEEYLFAELPDKVQKPVIYKINKEGVIGSIIDFGKFINSNVAPSFSENDGMLYKSWMAIGDILSEKENVNDNTDECMKYIYSISSFLNRKEDGYDKTNFQRTFEALDEVKKRDFVNKLSYFKAYFSIDLDVDQFLSTVKHNIVFNIKSTLFDEEEDKEEIIDNKEEIIVNKEEEKDEIKVDDKVYIKENIIINNEIKTDRENTGDNNLIDDHKDNIEDPIIDEADSVSAARYIEDIKASLAERREADGDLQEKIYKILAARHLADSVRHKRDRLDSTMITEDQVKDRVHDLKENATIRKFVDHITQHDNRREAIEAIDINGRGHCGKLDDMLKKFAKEAKVGELDNGEVMKRYMPTAKDRIEVLQDRLKKADTSIAEKRKIVFEIIKIRNITRAVRKSKSSLERPIPDSDPNIGHSLDVVLQHTSEENLNKLITPEIISAAASGHGGDMVEKLRENVKTQNINIPLLNKLVYGNTIQTRMDRLKYRAGQLSSALSHTIKDGGDTADLLRKSKRVIAEYLMLDGQTRGKHDINADSDKLVKDVPWDKVYTLKSKNPDNESQFKTTFKGYTPQEFANALNVMSESKTPEFVRHLAGKQAELTEQRRQAKQAEKNNTKPVKKTGGMKKS